MISIHLKIRKSDSEITDLASTHIKVDDTGNDWFQVPLWLKKVSSGLYAEYSYEDLPEAVKNQIKTKDIMEDIICKVPTEAYMDAVKKYGDEVYNFWLQMNGDQIDKTETIY